MSKKQSENLQEAPVKAITFSKQQFLKAANFTRIERDVLNALLKDGETYTLEEVQKMLNDFKQKVVK